jgi:hypothetical protein
MKDLDKMNLAIKYICECNWTPKTKDCYGDKISMGIDLDTAYLIRDLSVFIGKAQVYLDKQEYPNFDLMTQAFWNLFEDESFEVNDFDDWYEDNLQIDNYE